MRQRTASRSLLPSLTRRAAVSYAYDDDERLQSASSGGQATSYGYDPAANLLTMTLPAGNGYVETRAYDRAGRLTQIANVKGGATLSTFAITPDPVGNPLSVVRTGSLAQTQSYTYDDMDRLKSVCFQAGACPGGSDPFIRWTYDGVGNRLTEAKPTGTTSSTYNAADELTQAGSTIYTYDQNGNELSAGSRTFAYDLANRLKTTTQGNTTTAYTYDGDGKRLQASTGSQASKKTNFLWDVNQGLPQIALERDGNNSLLRRYTYGARRVSQTAGSSTSYFLHDGLGSVSNLTSSSGSTQWTWSYEPYGAIRTETKASGNQPDNFLKFAGEYADPTGLYHLRARQYDPASGRFLSRDPLGPQATDSSFSTYGYAANRPTKFVDPSGLKWCDPVCGVPNALAGGVEAVGEFSEKHEADLLLGIGSAGCFLLAPATAGLTLGCALVGAAAFTAGFSRAAVESGIVGDRPRDYCRFAVSAGTSVGLARAAHTFNTRFWVEPYVLGGLDRRILKGATGFLQTSIGYIADVAAPGACSTDSVIGASAPTLGRSGK